MEIFAHAFWVIAIFLILNLSSKFKKKLSIWQAVIWTIIPDIFSFVISFIYVLAGLIFGSLGGDIFHKLLLNSSPIYSLTLFLYAMSHSIIVFLIFFIILSLIFRKPLWPMFGWLIHILIDIPTHGRDAEWATPYLWPLTSPASPGIQWWTNPWFTVINYMLLIIVYVILVIIVKSKKNSS